MPEVAPVAPEAIAPPEATTEVPVEAPAEEKIDSKRFAALAKKERAIQTQKEAMKAEKAELEKMRAEGLSMAEAKAQAKQNPIKFMQSHGVSYEEATQFLLNGSKADPLQEVKDEFHQFRTEAAEKEAKAAEAQVKAQLDDNKAKIAAYHQEASDYVKANVDSYEMIHSDLDENLELIPATIDAQYAASQKVLTFKEAADKVEAYLEAKAEKVARTKKIQAKLQPLPAAKAKDYGSPFVSKKVEAPKKTLSNNIGATTASLNSPPKTAEERMQRAIARLKGEA